MAAPVALRGASLTLLHVSARLGAGSRAVAAPRACVRARAGASTLAAPALAGRVALRGVALPTLQARKPASGRAVAVSPVALFKQGKDSIQWLNVLCTIAACAAFIVPLALLPQPSLATLSVAILAVVVAALLFEAVRDALRRRQLRVSGTKDAWLAKAEAVATAARAKAAAEAGKSMQMARNWAERNVAGAKDEKDAELIRGMNEFLQ